MNEKLFRQKSLNKIKSPEDLNDYVRVSNPGIWLLLIAVIALLTGACLWGIFGYIDSTVSVSARVENGEAVCFIDESDADDIEPGMTADINGTKGVITGITDAAGPGCACSVDLQSELPDGIYPAEIVLRRLRPITFILN